MSLHLQPVQLLQTLIRFDTTNPPGAELECIRYLDNLLKSYGIETTLLASDENRPNLIARIKGAGNAPPLLLQGHVDVVPVDGQNWTRPPFSGELDEDGYVWGRGALDMKGGVAMMVTAFLRIKAENITPEGDIILCLLADEEKGGEFGAKFLVEQHPEQFEGVRYAIGEFGGFPMNVGGARCYAIQVAERVGCGMKLTIRGDGGHGAMIHTNTAMAKLGRILTRIDQKRLPIHITPATRLTVEGMAKASSPALTLVFRALLNPRLTERTLKTLGSQLQVMEPLFRNTINATVVNGGQSINVIPGEITLKLDGRMLPGFSAEQMIAEVRDLIAEPDVEIEQIGSGVPNMNELDMGLFPTLSEILQELEPGCSPIPYMLPAVSDGRWFATLGIQNYGYLPLNLPDDLNFSNIVHAADERVPASCIEFGADALFRLLSRYSATS